MATRNYEQTDDEERPDDMPDDFTQPISQRDIFSDTDLNSPRGERSYGRESNSHSRRSLVSPHAAMRQSQPVSPHAAMRQSQYSLASHHGATNRHTPRATIEPAFAENNVLEEDRHGSNYPGSANTAHHSNAHSPEYHRRHAHRSSMSTPLTVPVPENHFMEDNNSYHGAITGEEAAKRLKKAAMDSYLTRFSYRHHCYVLTVLKRDSHTPVGHFKLVIDQRARRNYYIYGMQNRFDNIEELLVYYEGHRIHPLFDTIGRRLTVQHFTHLQQKCSIQ